MITENTEPARYLSLKGLAGYLDVAVQVLYDLREDGLLLDHEIVVGRNFHGWSLPRAYAYGRAMGWIDKDGSPLNVSKTKSTAATRVRPDQLDFWRFAKPVRLCSQGQAAGLLDMTPGGLKKREERGRFILPDVILGYADESDPAERNSCGRARWEIPGWTRGRVLDSGMRMGRIAPARASRSAKAAA